MKLKTRMISLLLAVVMLACLIPHVDMTAQASVTGYDIVSYARQYLGYPYKMGTSGPKSFDCAGFVSYVFKHFGIDLPKNASAYFNNPTKYGTLVGKGTIKDAQMGDVIAWEGHVAIYTEDERCVEALGTDYGVCDWVRVDRHTNGKNYKVIRIKGVLPEGTPIISSLSATNSGIEIKWDKVANAANYRVYRKGADGSWVKLADTASESYVDKTAVSGKTYTYTIRGLSKDGKSFTSDYDKDGKSINYLISPKISSVTNGEKGVNISWGSVSGAGIYRVYYKTNSVGWTKIADTTATSYTWTGAKSGTNYTFTVRCITKDGKNYASGFDTVGKSIKYIAAPKLSSLENGPRGVQITWGAVSGAEKYRIFYKTGSGSWIKIADTTATTYAWTGPVNNTNYTFTIRCINKDASAYTSSHTAGKSIKYIAMPKISSVGTTSTGIQINWGKVTGAELYRVYYKTSTTGWTKIADTTATSYNWNNAQGGTEYTFTVRCITKDGKSYASGFDSTGKSLLFLATPKITSVSAENSGTVISWGKVAGAEKYRVYYKTASTGWTVLTDTTSTSYTWTGAKNGTNYTFTVRCVTKDSSRCVSGYDNTGKILKPVATPVFSSVVTTSTGLQINWSKVSGAELYRVYYKTGSTGWTKIADTTSTSYNWNGAKGGAEYTFTVRCITKDGKSYASGFDIKGKSLLFLSTPKITSVSAENSGTVISWGKVAGAEKYRVYYKTASTGWTVLTDTASTSYTWTGAKKGTEYTFTVRCVTKDSSRCVSGYDNTGKNLKPVATPVLSSVVTTSTGLQINWGKVTGAELYRVYYKTSTTGWTKIADTASTSYNWNSAKGGTEYTFTVRCVTKDGKSYASGFDSTGKSLLFLSTPKITSVSAENNGTVISWGKVTGAEKYRVYYKTASTGWTVLTDTASTSYTWTGAKKGTEYTFTVRCVTKDSSRCVSGYDNTGKSLKPVATPVLSSVVTTSTGLQINWSKVSGAELYRVYYKTGTTGWTKIADTTETSYNWNSAKSGAEYTFTVRCVTKDGKSYASGYDSKGMSVMYK